MAIFDPEYYTLGKFAFSFPCTVHAPLGVSMALDRAWIVKRKFTQCVVEGQQKYMNERIEVVSVCYGAGASKKGPEGPLLASVV